MENNLTKIEIPETEEKANVLVMGNSGVGKSTLINSVFKFDQAMAGDWKTVTKEMAIYGNEEIPFRAIDTRGLEYGYLAQLQTKNAIKKWSKDNVKQHNSERYIHVIWFCIDATAKRVSRKNLEYLEQVAKIWKDIPIVIVLTKSYSGVEIAGNIAMITQVVDQFRDKKHLNVAGIFPVVAAPFPITEETIIPPRGLEELVEKTNEIIPEALQLNKVAVRQLDDKIKQNNANALTAVATASAAVVGAVPIPIADSAILMPLQTGMVWGIEKIYNVNEDEQTMKQILNVILESGAITIGARTIISGLKAIPGINLAMSVVNAVVAGVITAILGEITIMLMGKIQAGEIKSEDIDWIKKFAESEMTERVSAYLDKLGIRLDGKDAQSIGKMIVKIFQDFNKKDGKK